MKILLAFVKIVDGISKWIAIATSALLPALVCVLLIEVVARYVFSRPTLWAYDIAIFMFGYMSLLAGAYVHKLKNHIQIDIIYIRLSPKGRAVMDMITSCLIVFFLLLVIIYSWTPAINALKAHETTVSEWGPPIGHFKLIIPVGASLLLLQAMANWARSIYFVVADRELRE